MKLPLESCKPFHFHCYSLIFSSYHSHFSLQSFGTIGIMKSEAPGMIFEGILHWSSTLFPELFLNVPLMLHPICGPSARTIHFTFSETSEILIAHCFSVHAAFSTCNSLFTSSANLISCLSKPTQPSETFSDPWEGIN